MEEISSIQLHCDWWMEYQDRNDEFVPCNELRSWSFWTHRRWYWMASASGRLGLLSRNSIVQSNVLHRRLYSLGLWSSGPWRARRWDDECLWMRRWKELFGFLVHSLQFLHGRLSILQHKNIYKNRLVMPTRSCADVFTQLVDKITYVVPRSIPILGARKGKMKTGLFIDYPYEYWELLFQTSINEQIKAGGWENCVWRNFVFFNLLLTNSRKKIGMDST